MNGHQHPNRLKHAVILALGLGVAHMAGAVGLGPIVGVNSHLGQPLSASIRVDNISKEQAQRATVSLASADEYRSRGIQRLPSHDQLRFKIVPAGNGYRIQVTSSGGIREPFINFLLTINSDGEKITREYALFLNPDPSGATPLPAAEPSLPAVETPVASALAAQPAPPPASTGGQSGSIPLALGHTGSSAVDSGPIGEARPSRGGVIPATEQSPGWGGTVAGAQRVALNTQAPATGNTAPLTTGGGSYVVKSGDTLYRIAKSVTPASGDINATMRAIQRANPHAFSSSSMNSLIAGVTLAIPDGSGAVPAEAAQAVATTANQPRRNNRRNANQAATQATPPASENVATDTPVTTDTPVDGVSTPVQGEEGATTAIVAEEVTGQAPVSAETGTPTPPPGETPPTDIAQTDAAPPAQETSPAGMDTSLSLEGLDSITEPGGSVNIGTPPTTEVAADPTATVAATTDTTTPVAEPVTTETAVAQTTPPVAQLPAQTEPVSQPPVAQPPVVAPVAAQSSSGLPFGLQIWHLAVAAGVLVLGLLLAVLMKARGRKREVDDIEDMSPAEIDRMVAELEKDSSLQQSLGGNLHDLDDLSYENLSREQAQPKSEADLLKARMAELAALEALEEEDDDDFDHLAKQAERLPAFDPAHARHEDTALDFSVDESEPTASAAQPARAGNSAENFFSDWDFSEEEPTVQTSAHEPDVDDFFNVEEQLPEVEDSQPESVLEALEAISQKSRSQQTADTLEFTLTDTSQRPVEPIATLQEVVEEEKVEAMEINLDLATSFIATGNAARARVWLDEVMLEGSPSQKALAAQLLKKIDAQK